ncbi:hypothetical protein [Phytohabitans aurantiacus]|uniref:Recombinase zinc beta ribbon domain-containing protein n=1 Tax=Phytohabitans aurantiacus TaxID=3016789 RepID=A0ABQ5QZ87_9ACTN|nr:hypothetical protein [Phytohabitans aurantiacus]GLH99866.1 hypothetical protein Pa4123_51430 [Phytohabitans aurantiacus]
MVLTASTEQLRAEYPLCGLLVCASCDLPLSPLASADGERCYQSPCGCRLRPVDASTVERVTYEALARRGLVRRQDIPRSGWATLFVRAVAAVRVGAVPDELMFAWQT